MPTYVRGDAIEHATSYELYKKAGSNYTKLATNTEINFDVSTLGLGGGDHVLVVKAKALGYSDSDYSNEVVYSVPKEYDSYIGTAVYKNVMRIESSGGVWIESTAGTAQTTDLIAVTSTDQVWIQYIFFKSAQFSAGGFYDEGGNLVKPLVAPQFGIAIDANAGSGAAAFATPSEETRVSIADIEAQTGKTIKYVKFTAWPTSAGGLNNTEARIYH